jgi:predicted transcriptional regulator
MKSLFGSLSRERILTFIAAREQGYAREITEFWQCPDQPIKRELNRLESDGVLVAKSSGRTILYSINPRFFLKQELLALLLKIIDAYPPMWKEKLLFNRRRPRAKGKQVVYVESDMGKNIL